MIFQKFLIKDNHRLIKFIISLLNDILKIVITNFCTLKGDFLLYLTSYKVPSK